MAARAAACFALPGQGMPPSGWFAALESAPPSVFPPWCSRFHAAWLGPSFRSPMSLVPRWRYMTDDAKALTRRSAVSAAVVLLTLLLFRGLLPWIVLGLVAWWIWKSISR